MINKNYSYYEKLGISSTKDAVFSIISELKERIKCNDDSDGVFQEELLWLDDIKNYLTKHFKNIDKLKKIDRWGVGFSSEEMDSYSIDYYDDDANGEWVEYEKLEKIVSKLF